eukprot:g16329.t2
MGEWGEASARGKPGAEHLGQEMKRQTDLGQGELQAKRAQAVEMVKSRAPRLEGAPWNPLRELRDSCERIFRGSRPVKELVIQKEERGEEGALRGMVKGFDHERSSLMSWPMFKALLRDQVGLDALNEEKMEFAEYIFQALDDDGDGIVPYPDFEKDTAATTVTTDVVVTSVTLTPRVFGASSHSRKG